MTFLRDMTYSESLWLIQSLSHVGLPEILSLISSYSPHLDSLTLKENQMMTLLHRGYTSGLHCAKRVPPGWGGALAHPTGLETPASSTRNWASDSQPDCFHAAWKKAHTHQAAINRRPHDMTMHTSPSQRYLQAWHAPLPRVYLDARAHLTKCEQLNGWLAMTFSKKTERKIGASRWLVLFQLINTASCVQRMRGFPHGSRRKDLAGYCGKMYMYIYMYIFIYIYINAYIYM